MDGDTGAYSYLVFFEDGGTRLTEDSKSTMALIVADVCRQLTTRISVYGHTDRKGAPATNRALSLRRAEAVRRELVAHGVQGNLVVMHGSGEGDPLIPTKDDVSNAENRRAEISLDPIRRRLTALPSPPCSPTASPARQ